jgi:uncharacterized protein YcbK (DUF882 family)
MPFSRWGRRSFLKVSLLATVTLCGPGAGLARALLSPEKTEPGILSLLHLHTGERMQAAFRESNGGYDRQILAAIDHLLRCHYTDEVHPIDIRTIEYLSLLNQQMWGGRDIHIISGFRSPRYNELLIQRGGQVARRSLHLEGRALDIRIPGVSTATLRKAALDLALGGVGYYPRSDFVHIDSGHFRSW